MSNIKNPQSNPLKSSAPVRPPGGNTAPKKVYVCSPFRPTAVSLADRAEEQRSNIERALKACRILAMMGIQPLAPHLYFTRFLKDDVAAERDTGMRFALSWLEQADELWVFGERVSDGMAQEIAKAKELGKPVHTLPEPGRVAELLVQSIAQMTTPLFMLRCVQLGISIADLDLLTIGLVNDMFTERQNDEYPYQELASQADFDRF